MNVLNSSYRSMTEEKQRWIFLPPRKLCICLILLTVLMLTYQIWTSWWWQLKEKIMEVQYKSDELATATAISNLNEEDWGVETCRRHFSACVGKFNFACEATVPSMLGGISLQFIQAHKTDGKFDLVGIKVKVHLNETRENVTTRQELSEFFVRTGLLPYLELISETIDDSLSVRANPRRKTATGKIPCPHRVKFNETLIQLHNMNNFTICYTACAKGGICPSESIPQSSESTVKKIESCLNNLIKEVIKEEDLLLQQDLQLYLPDTLKHLQVSVSLLTTIRRKIKVVMSHSSTHGHLSKPQARKQELGILDGILQRVFLKCRQSKESYPDYAALNSDETIVGKMGRRLKHFQPGNSYYKENKSKFKRIWHSIPRLSKTVNKRIKPRSAKAALNADGASKWKRSIKTKSHRTLEVNESWRFHNELFKVNTDKGYIRRVNRISSNASSSVGITGHNGFLQFKSQQYNPINLPNPATKNITGESVKLLNSHDTPNAELPNYNKNKLDFTKPDRRNETKGNVRTKCKCTYISNSKSIIGPNDAPTILSFGRGPNHIRSEPLALRSRTEKNFLQQSSGHRRGSFKSSFGIGHAPFPNSLLPAASQIDNQVSLPKGRLIKATVLKNHQWKFLRSYGASRNSSSAANGNSSFPFKKHHQDLKDKTEVNPGTINGIFGHSNSAGVQNRHRRRSLRSRSRRDILDTLRKSSSAVSSNGIPNLSFPDKPYWDSKSSLFKAQVDKRLIHEYRASKGILKPYSSITEQNLIRDISKKFTSATSLLKTQTKKRLLQDFNAFNGISKNASSHTGDRDPTQTRLLRARSRRDVEISLLEAHMEANTSSSSERPEAKLDYSEATDFPPDHTPIADHKVPPDEDLDVLIHDVVIHSPRNWFWLFGTLFILAGCLVLAFVGWFLCCLGWCLVADMNRAAAPYALEPC